MSPKTQAHSFEIGSATDPPMDGVRLCWGIAAVGTLGLLALAIMNAADPEELRLGGWILIAVGALLVSLVFGYSFRLYNERVIIDGQSRSIVIERHYWSGLQTKRLPFSDVREIEVDTYAMEDDGVSWSVHLVLRSGERLLLCSALRAEPDHTTAKREAEHIKTDILKLLRT